MRERVRKKVSVIKQIKCFFTFSRNILGLVRRSIIIKRYFISGILKAYSNLNCVLNTSHIFKFNKCIANTNILHTNKYLSSCNLMIQCNNTANKDAKGMNLAASNDHTLVAESTEILEFLLYFRSRYRGWQVSHINRPNFIYKY
jgi:hypothetical protein